MLAPLIAIVSNLAGDEPTYLQAARSAAQWIRIELEKPVSDHTLYSGTPGVILFFTEAYYSTRDKSYLKDASKLGDDLYGAAAKYDSSGLYTGMAGAAFALNELAKATTEVRFRLGSESLLERIEQTAIKKGAGVEWQEGYDIVSGSAGIGCFLLYAAKEFGSESALNLAKKAGDRLIEVAIPDGDGLKWKLSPTYERLMPNFSHGTAGIAYFLARLYEETKEKRYLKAAEKGAAYLIALTNSEGLIFHNDQNGKDLYYLGWCHGPVGTSRLFGILHRITGDKRYEQWIDKASATLMSSGIPAKRTPGFWNNVGQCCGSAGVSEFFLDIYRFDKKSEQLEFAKMLSADILARGEIVEVEPRTRDKPGGGMSWTQAEHRVQPDNLQAQIGYMQGAAGIGMLLLRMDAQGRAARPRIHLPDNPFRK